MGKRDLLFASLVLGGFAALGSSLALPRTRPVDGSKVPAADRPAVAAEVDAALRSVDDGPTRTLRPSRRPPSWPGCAGSRWR
jgi:hypothetical protein